MSAIDPDALDAVVRERIAAQVAASVARRQQRRQQRAQLAERRTAGLQQRHATKLARLAQKRRHPVIPATEPFDAVFKRTTREGREVIDRNPVVAWTDTTYRAMVVDYRSGDLVPADGCSGFVGLEPAERGYIAVLPGGGWRVRWNDGSDEPVLGWAINREGYGSALAADKHGTVEPIDSNHGATLIPPEKP